MFPGPGATGHLVETKSFTRRVVMRSGVVFALHDLRRTFITIAESLGTPPYALKRLLNHRVDVDVTGGYIVIDPERLRVPVEQIAGSHHWRSSRGRRRCGWWRRPGPRGFHWFSRASACEVGSQREARIFQ